MIKYIMVVMLFSTAAYAAEGRSRTAIEEFKRLNPCPVEGPGSCFDRGYVVDHIGPLCAGHPDTPENMQWQSIEESYKKDIEERRYCRALKKAADHDKRRSH